MPKFIFKRWHGNPSLFIIIFCVALLVPLFLERMIYGLLGTIGLCILLIILYQSEKSFRQDLESYIFTLQKRVDKSGQLALNQLPIGVLLYDRHGTIEWHNPFVKGLFGEPLIGQSLFQPFPSLQGRSGADPVHIEIHGKFYEFLHRPDERLYFLYEVTRYVELQQRHRDEEALLGFLYLDNFHEVDQGITDQEATILLNKVTSTISNWAAKYKIALRKIDSDKMFFVLQQKFLDQLIKSRFDILDDVRERTHESKIPITLSIGIASVGETMIDRVENAQAALDIALARGGDQVAIQDQERIFFFGGKTHALEKRNRVRARVISQSMSNLIRDSKQILIMGHKQPDMDAIGSAVGVVRFALNTQRKAYIVIEDSAINPSTERLMRKIREHEYLRNHLVTSEQALQMIDQPDTLLILVDTHKPSIAFEPTLLEKANQIVVIDHHRRGKDFVKDAVIVYLEPYASSTSELVTELIQHQKDRISMDRLEATALFAGIVVDTQNFSVRAGSRTFEAASFLRRHGADLMMVQSLLKEDLHQFIKRSEIIKNTERYYDRIAIAMGKEDEEYNQLLIAQTADTLLNMRGIEASFVIGRREDGLISISARSQGQFNVQLIMEELGGGGHLTNAACQLENIGLQESKEKLISLLEKTVESEDQSG